MAIQEPSDRDVYLAALGNSDEDVEALLSGGADIDELIAAGVLDDDKPSSQDDENEGNEAESSTFPREEVLAEMAYEQKFIGSYGHGYRPISL